MSKSIQELYDAVPDRLLGYKLSRFFRHCSKQGLEPKDVTDSTVSEFEDDLIKETLHKEPSKVAREAVLIWNKMKSVVPGWPDITLRRVAARVPWTIPLEQFPETLQSDVDAWCERLRMSDLFDEDAPVRACSPVTIKHRRFQIRMMASALVLSGIEVRSLSDLVVPDNFRQGIQFSYAWLY